MFFFPSDVIHLSHSRDLKLEAYIDYYYRDYPALVKTSRQTCVIDQGEFKALQSWIFSDNDVQIISSTGHVGNCSL